MRVVDTFAGPGGWDEGMASIDIRSIGLEWDMDACRTRVAAGHMTVRADVTEYPPNAFRGFDGLVASPPCQSFSMAGKRDGEADIPRIHAAILAHLIGVGLRNHPHRASDVVEVVEGLFRGDGDVAKSLAEVRRSMDEYDRANGRAR